MHRSFSIGSYRKKLTLSVAAFAIMTGVTGGVALAQTAAGQRIQNQATATYSDSLGNDFQAQSNLASIEVRAILASTLTSDLNQTVASNQTTSFQHILTNTGNIAQDFTFVLSQVPSGDTGDFAQLGLFLDENDNGIADAGEPAIAGALTIDAGSQVSLVIAARVPTASLDSTFGVDLRVVTTDNNTTDPEGVGGHDTDGTTVRDFATISNDAVLGVFLESTRGPSTDDVQTLDYTTTVTNTGTEDARDVVIYMGLPAGTAHVSSSSQGLTGAGDELPVFAELSEENLGIDLNGDGDTDDDTEIELGLDLDNDGVIGGSRVSGVYMIDALLPAGTTVELSLNTNYSISAFGADGVIRGTSHANGDLDGDTATAEPVVSSGTVTDLVAQDFGVNVSDTGIGAAAGVNDGGDDDGEVNVVQQVDIAQSGELVLFDFVITNEGNGEDTFDLSISTFGDPIDGVFSFWNAGGTIALLDTDGNGIIDTGPLGQGEVLNVQVRVQLSPTTESAVPLRFNFGAMSAGAPDDNPALSSSLGEIGSIVAPTVDINIGAADNNIAVNAGAYLGDDAPVATNAVAIGETATFQMTLQNDSSVSDSFELSAGGAFISQVTGQPAVIGQPPTGWDLVFTDTSGNIITTTPSLPSRTVFNFNLQVTTSEQRTQSLSDRSFVFNNADDDTVDGNDDGDGDFAIFVQAVSSVSSARDVLLAAVDVLPSEDVTLLQDNSGQVQAGGSVNYSHSVRNEGNTIEFLALDAVNGTEDWSSNILVDTDADGEFDIPLETLGVSDEVTIVDTDGSSIIRSIVAAGVELLPGQAWDFVAQVFAPTTAPNGQLDQLAVTATYNAGGATLTNTDRSEVVDGQLRLVKTASISTECAGAGAIDLSPETVFSISAGQADPDDCIIWDVIATNTGVDDVDDVTIFSPFPAFTNYEPGTIRYCEGSSEIGCTFSVLTDAPGDDEGTARAGDIRVSLPETASGSVPGTIGPGESVTLRYMTRVE